MTTDPGEIYETIAAEIDRVIVGHEDLVEGFTIALLTGGHVLLEGVPGVAKTTLAKTFAQATGIEFSRIQMTPDIMPADITGTHIYQEATGEFHLQRGPVFANVVLADEINRATPKTQSALLEAMQEGHVTIEGETLDLPEPFMVIATQNPIEMEGTFQLPEAQRDRFQFKLTADLPPRAEERELLYRFNDAPHLDADGVEEAVPQASLLDAKAVVDDVYVDDRIMEYILDLIAATREHPHVEHGASPRASIVLLTACKGRAAIHGRDYAIPLDVKSIAPVVLAHRLVLATEADLSDVTAIEVVEDVLADVESPGSEGEDDAADAFETEGGVTADASSVSASSESE